MAEQRYEAVLAVIKDGRTVTETAAAPRRPSCRERLRHIGSARRRAWSSRRRAAQLRHDRAVAAHPQRRKRNVISWNGLSSRSIDGPSLAAPLGKGRSSRSVAFTDPTSASAVTVARARPPSDS